MTRLEPVELGTFRKIQARAPFRLSLPGIPLNVRDVPTLLSWLSSYVDHVDRQIEKLRTEDRDRARAAVVLRGLRQDLANAASTLAQLDAQVDAGELEVVEKLAP